MKIKVGDYVRTKHDGIQKVEHIEVDEIFGNLYTLEKDNYKQITEKEFIKYGMNKIDLIEPGDYVNGSKVQSISDKFDDNVTRVCIDTQSIEDSISDDEIYSTVTKEQFKEVEYDG